MEITAQNTNNVVLYMIYKFSNYYLLYSNSQVVLVVKNPPVNAGDVRHTGSIPGSEDPLEKDTVTHSNIVA